MIAARPIRARALHPGQQRARVRSPARDTADSQDLAGAHAHTQAPPLQWRGTSVASPPPGSVRALHSARGPAHVTLAPPFVLFCPTCPSPGEGPPANPGAGSAPSALAPWPHVPEPARFSAVRSLFPVLPLPSVPPTLHGRVRLHAQFLHGKRNLISLSPAELVVAKTLNLPGRGSHWHGAWLRPGPEARDSEEEEEEFIRIQWPGIL